MTSAGDYRPRYERHQGQPRLSSLVRSPRWLSLAGVLGIPDDDDVSRRQLSVVIAACRAHLPDGTRSTMMGSALRRRALCPQSTLAHKDKGLVRRRFSCDGQC